MTPDTAIAVRNAADLVDATPYVIGFHPTESLVVLGISAGRVCFGARYDLPPPDGDDIMQLGAVISAQQARCVAVLAYGPPATVDPVVRRALAVFDAFRVRVLEALRVHDGRWWSYFCSEPTCCPSTGTPFDTATSVIAAEATYRGQVALPSRQVLVAQVAPVDGAARVAMAAATERARSRIDALLTDDQHGDRAIRRAGRLAVREAEKRYRAGRALTDDEIAWLGALLLDPDVHEYTLARLGDEEWRLALWTDVLRRVEPIYVAAVGCVLSYLAWRAGQGALARVAVDRALHSDPEHRMAALLDEVLGLGIGPHAMSALDSPPRVTLLIRAEKPDKPHRDRLDKPGRDRLDKPGRSRTDDSRRDHRDEPGRDRQAGPHRDRVEEPGIGRPAGSRRDRPGSGRLAGSRSDHLDGPGPGRDDGSRGDHLDGPGPGRDDGSRGDHLDESGRGWHDGRHGDRPDEPGRGRVDEPRREKPAGAGYAQPDTGSAASSPDEAPHTADAPPTADRPRSDEPTAKPGESAPSSPEPARPPTRARRLRRALRRRSQ